MSTKLIEATKKNNIELVRLLLTTKENINYQQKDTLKTALHYALQMGHYAVAKILVNHRARTNIFDVDGFSALSHVLDYEMEQSSSDPRYSRKVSTKTADKRQFLQYQTR